MILNETVIYRKSQRGHEELTQSSGLLHQRYRRTLIMLDGTRDLCELSVLLRPGELQLVIPHLLLHGLIEEIKPNDPDYPKNYVQMVPATRDQGVFLALRDRTVERINVVFGDAADMITGEITACNNADDMRIKLRDLEVIFAGVLGDHEGATLARDIGRELLTLVPRT